MHWGIRGLLLTTLCVPSFAMAIESPHQVGYYCGPETASITDGQYYLPPADPCVYLSPTMTGFRVGDVYKGTVGSSTLVIGHGLDSTAGSWQLGDIQNYRIKGLQQGDDVFVAIYIERPFPIGDRDLIRFRSFFRTGADTPPHAQWGIIRFKYGVPPPPAGCEVDCFSSVLFLPGIESSRLYRPDYEGGTERLWEPGKPDDIRDLFMTPQGTSIREDVYAREGDVIDEIPIVGANVYKSFIASMDALKNAGSIADWSAVPYDWRLSIDDVLTHGAETDGRISYAGPLSATATPYILQELRRLAGGSKSGKVTIVAHSNGGLVAKRLTEMTGADASELIDRIIFVAVPQRGTPLAAAAGLHGYDQALGAGLIASDALARSFGSTSPMLYQLLPSASYFVSVATPVIRFDDTLPEWRDRYGSVESFDALRIFLADTFGRVHAEDGDTDQPIQMSDSLLASAEALHDSIDTWQPPAGVEVTEIAGWGVPTTVSGMTYSAKEDGIQPEMHFTVDGDGTVVVPSAHTIAGSERVWVDLERYNKENKLQTGFGLLSVRHANIFEVPSVLMFIRDVLTNESFPVSHYPYVKSASPASLEATIAFTLHSPLTLDLFDAQGRHTGVSTSTGQIIEDIPGTYFTQFGDVKYLFADAAAPYRVVMRGYATGTFTFAVEEFLGDQRVASTTWKDIPTTPGSDVTIDSTGSIHSLSPLNIDREGNGSVDVAIAPILNDVVTMPKIPLTVIANDATMVLGDTLPSLTVRFEGRIDTEDDIMGTPLCVSAPEGVGTFPITCTQGSLESDTYSFDAFVPGELTVEYDWRGFSQPINDTSYSPLTQSVFKVGSTVPVKFNLRDVNGALVQARSAPMWLAPQRGNSMKARIDEATNTTAASTGSHYRYDALEKQYIYNWSTKGLTPGYWYRIFAQLDDGKVYSVIIGLR